MGNAENQSRVVNLPLSQALCLPVSAEEILEACNATNESNVEQVSRVNTTNFKKTIPDTLNINLSISS